MRQSIFTSIFLLLVISVLPTLANDPCDQISKILSTTERKAERKEWMNCNFLINIGCKEQIEKYTKQIELNSNNVSAYHNRGLAKDSLGDYRGAIQDISKSIEVDEACLRKIKKQLKELKSNNSVYNWTKTTHEDQLGMFYSSRSRINTKLDNYKAAIQDLNRVIELSPYVNSALTWRGDAKYNLGDYRGAIQDYTKSIELYPNFAGGDYYSRGLAKIALGQKDSGCLDLSKAGEMGLMRAYDLIKEHCQ